jgi:hypothetical protein
VAAADTAALIARLVSAGIPVSEISPERRSLEDLVLSLTSDGADRVDRPGDAGQPGDTGRPGDAGQPEAAGRPEGGSR